MPENTDLETKITEAANRLYDQRGHGITETFIPPLTGDKESNRPLSRSGKI